MSNHDGLQNDVAGESLTVPAVLIALGRLAAVRRYDRRRNNKLVGALRGFAFSIVSRFAVRGQDDLTDRNRCAWQVGLALWLAVASQ